MPRKAQKVYRANERAVFNDDVAQWIGEQMEANGGHIKPKELVDLSRKKGSPGHNLFIWDDAIAGEAYRVEQARFHLRMVNIEIIYEGKPEQMRACLPVFIDHGEGKPPERSHVATDLIKSSPDLARQVVEGAAREVKLWRRRYERYEKVFGPVFKAIDKLEV